MAYAAKSTGSWRGPYPNKAGEFCGNTLLSDLILGADGTTILFRKSYPWQRMRLGSNGYEKVVNQRMGRPAVCQAGSSEEMLKTGYTGLYLIKDEALLSFETAVDTDELAEEVVSGQRPVSKPFVLPGE